MPSGTLTSKGQITVPKIVRETLAVKAGDRLRFRIHDDGTVTVEAETVDLASMKGRLKTRVGHVSIDDMNAAIRLGAARK